MTITLHLDDRGRLPLPTELRERLGVAPGGAVQAEETAAGLLLKAMPEPPRPAPALLAEFDRILADLPPEEHAKLPADGAEQHDHYIYGTPKRPARGDA
jgi:bifunctional DNA-binding transcriptional regulator/antitoxin component of YhaV-PrlF toxin-antitoxin module